MTKSFTNEILSEQIEQRKAEAEALLSDVSRLEKFLIRLEDKLQKVPIVGNKLSNIPVFISLVKAYAQKEYRDAPIGTILAIIAVLIYFLSPIDLIPDAIPFLGYTDDAAVIAFVWKMVEDDVEEYKKWRDQGIVDVH